VQVNGKSPKSFIDFTDLLAANSANEISLKIQRGTTRKDVAVRLVPEKSVFHPGLIRDKLGLNLEEVTPELADRYGLRASEGYVITGVLADGPAAAAGLERGILVTAIDGQTPADLTAAAKLLYSKKKGDRVLLDIAVRQRVGNYFVLRQGSVELASR
jgi:S1-C subfamily serine protease